jgi:hypothetical protein
MISMQTVWIGNVAGIVVVEEDNRRDVMVIKSIYTQSNSQDVIADTRAKMEQHTFSSFTARAEKALVVVERLWLELQTGSKCQKT